MVNVRKIINLDKDPKGISLPGISLDPKAYNIADLGGFPMAVGKYWTSEGVTVREQRMMEFVNDISDKPGWETKVFDDNIVTKWRAEADARIDNPDGDVYLSQKMFDFCIAELRDKAKRFEETGRVNVLDAELNITKSDFAVPETLRIALCEAVKVLENVPENKKDWHPGSGKKVLDLVHPSLFPVIFGLSLAVPKERVPVNSCLDYIGTGEVVRAIHLSEHQETPGEWASEPLEEYGSYQWLPAEVELTNDGAKITSYINNLHPKKNQGLYKVLEQVVGVIIPLWEDCLSGFWDRRRLIIESSGEDDWTYPDGLKYQIPQRAGKEYEWADPILGSDHPDGDDDWLWEDDFDVWKSQHRILKQREPRDYIHQAELLAMKEKERGNKPAATIKCREQYPEGLQVIFKLANIHLTPESPEYDGGAWHVEGALNEMICASAIYYYDQENITDSHLAFRQSVQNDDIINIPEQGHFDSFEHYLGVHDEVAVQSLGRVLTRQGRVLAFPNCVQHQVQPFKLADATQPGHRKILAMFLVDPNYPILSSANVPPQRRDWWAEELRKNAALAPLPNELFDQVVREVEFPLSWEKAVDVREKLMEERGGIRDEFMAYVEARTFSFCEH